MAGRRTKGVSGPFAVISAINGMTIKQSSPGVIQLGSGDGTAILTQANNPVTAITQLTGDVTAGPGVGSQAATLATVNSNVGSFTDASITVNAKGLITAAASGPLGTLVSSNVASGAGGNITSGSTFDVTSIALTAGTWLVYGNLGVAAASGTVTQQVVGWLNTSSATLPTAPNKGAEVVLPYTSAASDQVLVPVGMMLLVVATTATVYLSGNVLWTVAQPTSYGFVGAIRLI